MAWFLLQLLGSCFLSLLQVQAQFLLSSADLTSSLGGFHEIGDYLRDREVTLALKDATATWISLAQVSWRYVKDCTCVPFWVSVTKCSLPLDSTLIWLVMRNTDNRGCSLHLTPQESKSTILIPCYLGSDPNTNAKA